MAVGRGTLHLGWEARKEAKCQGKPMPGVTTEDPWCPTATYRPRGEKLEALGLSPQDFHPTPAAKSRGGVVERVGRGLYRSHLSSHMESQVPRGSKAFRQRS